MTTRAEISQWFDEGVEQGASHLLVVCDTFDHEDYPTYIKFPEDAKSRSMHLGSMQSLMECYVLDPARKEAQLNEGRAHNFDIFNPKDIKKPEPKAIGVVISEALTNKAEIIPSPVKATVIKAPDKKDPKLQLRDMFAELMKEDSVDSFWKLGSFSCVNKLSDGTVVRVSIKQPGAK